MASVAQRQPDALRGHAVKRKHSADGSGHHLELGAHHGDNQPSGPQEGVEGLTEPIDISLAIWEKSVPDPSKFHRSIY